MTTNLERVRPEYACVPRQSSPTLPDEWTITEDGYRFGRGDRVYNYYDGFWVTVLDDPADPEKDYRNGWFDAVSDDGRHVSLNCARVSAEVPR